MTFEVIEAKLATGPLTEQAKPVVLGFRTQNTENSCDPHVLFKILKKFGKFRILEETECVNSLQGIFAFNEKHLCTEMQNVTADFVSIHTKLN